GRATFLPLDNLRPPRPLELPEARGLIGLAAELVTYDDPALRPAVRLLLGRVIVVQELETARELHRQLRDRGGFQIVTLEGELLRSSGTLTGGRQRNERREGGLLARERERRALPSQVEALEREAAALQAALQRSEEQAHVAAQELRTLTEQRRHAERQQQEARRALEGAVRDLEQLLQEAAWQRGLLAEAEEERMRLETTRGRLEDEQGEAATQLTQAEATVAEVSQSLAELADAGLGREVSERRTQVAVLTQERENHRILLETRERELQRLRERIAARESRNDSLAEELQALKLRVEELQAQYAAARAAADELAAQIPPLEQEVTALETGQGNFEEQGTELRRVLRNAEQRLVQAEIEARRREEQLRALRREIEDALDIVVADLPENLSVQQPLPLRSAVSPLPTVMELPEGLEQQIRDLRTQIRRLGPVNTAAQEEYHEVKERHGFLREQAADLETASAHLRKIVTELDGLMETAFRTTFKAVASEFTRIFRLLFNGGMAKLELLTSADGEIAGVEIMARPPGKRTSGLGMLSGGERTLTAVALLFAVMRISPTPFCVLDEVDAMLDEANVSRFRILLQELGRQTQFLVITHNRHTVEAADTIYGVSMSEDGVSQVLSLSLKDLPAAES
ncbi:MAG: chromosome segregation protein SMC, partial [Chloroflexota bacterium]|nr:chromosome segregation protein SMC [Chloroflexota bacterium]